MTQSWTPYVTAQALLEILPELGRLIAVRIRETGEEEATVMQIGVLLRIIDKPITTSELAKHRRVSLQAASVLVQALVDRGWLTRTPDPDDRRQSLLQVTPEGVLRAQAAQELVTKAIAEVLSELTPEELNAAGVFLPALRRLTKAQAQSDTAPEPQP